MEVRALYCANVVRDWSYLHADTICRTLHFYFYFWVRNEALTLLLHVCDRSNTSDMAKSPQADDQQVYILCIYSYVSPHRRDIEISDRVWLLIFHTHTQLCGWMRLRVVLRNLPDLADAYGAFFTDPTTSLVRAIWGFCVSGKIIVKSDENDLH